MEHDTDIYEKFAQLQFLMHARGRSGMRGMNGGRGPHFDPTRGQGRILSLLKLKDGVSTKTLSGILGIRVSSLNELLSKLEKGGYVTRRPSEEDKRVMLVELTDKGHAAEQPSVETPPLFDGFTDEEKEQFAAYLDRMIASLLDAMDDDERASFEREWKRRGELFARVLGGEDPSEGDGAGFAGRGFPFGGERPEGFDPFRDGMRSGFGEHDGRGWRGDRGGFEGFGGFGGHGRRSE